MSRVTGSKGLILLFNMMSPNRRTARLVSDLPQVINSAISLSCPVILASMPPEFRSIMARGNNSQRIFLKSGDYEAFLEALGNVRGRYPFDLYATSIDAGSCSRFICQVRAGLEPYNNPSQQSGIHELFLIAAYCVYTPTISFCIHPVF